MGLPAAVRDEIAKEIEGRKGSKPTPGTIYPALKELKRRGLVKAEKHGRTIVYSITPRGRHSADNACEHLCRMFGDIVEKRKA